MKKKIKFEIVPAESSELSYYWRNKEKVNAQKKEYNSRPEVIARKKEQAKRRYKIQKPSL